MVPLRNSPILAAFALLLLLPAGTAVAGSAGEAKAPPKPDWDKAYPEDRILDIHLTVAWEDWNKLPLKPFDYYPARFECGDVVVPKVGVRVKGNSSAGVPNERRSFKIDFDRYDKDARFHGLSKINLHNGFKDPTMMRESLAYALFRDAGVPASRTGFARLYITIPGKFKHELLGLYSNVEQVNGAFLKDRFKDPSGTLWKGESGSDFRFLGDDPEPYGGYEIKANENRGDYTPIIELVRTLGTAPDASFASEIAKRLDVERFLAFMAANTLLSNLDSPAGTGHNYYVYHEPATGLITVIPWDLNEAFGHFRQGSGSDVADMSIAAPYTGEKILFKRILAVDSFMSRYIEILKKLNSGPFSASRLNAKIDRIHALIRAAAKADPLMPYSFEEFERAIDNDLQGGGGGGMPGGGALGLKPFIKNRVASVAAQIAGRSKGIKPRGQEFRAPPTPSAASAAQPAFSGRFMLRLSPDRKLLRTDLESFETATGGALPAVISSGADEGFVRDFLERFDRDKDSKVSASEFPGPRDVFTRADRNRDGSLDRGEIASLEKRPDEREAGAELLICAGEKVIAVVGANTLFAFDAASLAYLGHNRYGIPPESPMERRGRAGKSAAVCEGDTLWVLSGQNLFRIDLAKLTVKKNAELPSEAAAAGEKGDWVKLFDRNGDGRIDRDEWRESRSPPELFQMNDRNQDGFLDAGEAKSLPPPPDQGAGDVAMELKIAGDSLFALLGDALLRFDKKSLEFKGKAALKEDRSGNR